jgi:hypothetical protein
VNSTAIENNGWSPWRYPAGTETCRALSNVDVQIMKFYFEDLTSVLF